MKRHIALSLVIVAFAVVVAGATGVTALSQPSAGQEEARFFVTGFVKNPGAYQFVGRVTVAEGIAIAGGLTERGGAVGITIQRRVDGNLTEVAAKMDDAVQPSDTIRVRRRIQ